MTARITLIVCSLLILSGCAARQAHDALQQRQKLEEQALAEANKDAITRCFHGVAYGPDTPPPKRNEIVSHSKCFTALVNEKVIPVVLYPDLMMELRAKALRNAEAYANGKISYEELQARGQENAASYIQQWTGRANAVIAEARQQDAVTSANINQSLAQQQQQRQQQLQQQQALQASRPVQTNCYSYGNNVSCTSH